MLNLLRRFIALESSGGILLGLAALLALMVANSPLAPWYESFLNLPGEVRIGSLLLTKPLLVWVNDLWMAVFFLLVGLEIKRELLEGELNSIRQAALPTVAALGGMIVPALIYAAFNFEHPVARAGWAIPTATDIAFALGVLQLLGPRVPLALKVFLTAVAIIDDLGAIVVIALFYTDHLSLPMLLAAGVGVLALMGLNRSRVMLIGPYVLVGLLVWLCVLKSGVHATLAGVITGLLIPLRAPDGHSPLHTVEHALQPWVAYLILPMFAFANAGVSLAGVSWATLMQPVPLGIAGGLLLGKTVGVSLAVWLMVRFAGAALPTGCTPLHMLGLALLCGIGFTMSLFIGGLAFEGQDATWTTQLKLGVLMGSALSALAGVAVMRVALARPSR